MTYITRHGYRIPTKDELEAQAHPAPVTEASSIPGFNFHALLREVDIRIVGNLLYRPTVKREARWEARAEYMGYKFYVNLYQQDIDFLNRVFGTDIGKGSFKTFWRDMLPEALDIGIREIDEESGKPVGIKCVWDGSRVVYVEERYNPFREGSPLAPQLPSLQAQRSGEGPGEGLDTFTTVKVSEGDNGSTNERGWVPWQAALHATIERGIQAHNLLQSVAWLPPEAPATGQPNFVCPRQRRD